MRCIPVSCLHPTVINQVECVGRLGLNQDSFGNRPDIAKKIIRACQMHNWDVIKQPDYKEQWHPALSAQIKSLEDNETWELVKLPPGEVALGGQWILNQRKGYG